MIFISQFGKSQSDTAISYSEVIHVDSTTKDQLFSRARIWVNDAFKSGKDVTQLADKDAGTITGSANFIIHFTIRKGTWPARITFSFKILIKDGRYKYIFDNFFDQGLESDNPQTSGLDDFGSITTAKTTTKKEFMVSVSSMNVSWNSVQREVDKEMVGIITDLKRAMKTKMNEDF